MTDDEAACGLFEPPVQVATMEPSSDLDALAPSERALLGSAVERRRREFASGRILARRLLGVLGAHDQPLLRDEDRRPLWPTALTGSISHADGICVVAVAPRSAVRALGIDVEDRSPLDRASWHRVVRPDEWRLLAAWRLLDGRRALDGRDELAGAFVTTLFSIKECVLKCCSAATGRAVDLLAIALTRLERQRFGVRILDERARVAGVTAVEGRACWGPHHVFAGAALPADPGRER